MNKYAYHKADLLAAYGIAILVAIIANLLGAYAYIKNKVAHDINYTSLVSSSADDTITTVFKQEDPSTRGKLPLPKSIGDVEIKFTPLDEGGLGFQTAEEVRRRSSVAPVTSPQLPAMKKVHSENLKSMRVSLERVKSANVQPEKRVRLQPERVQPERVQPEEIQLDEIYPEQIQPEKAQTKIAVQTVKS